MLVSQVTGERVPARAAGAMESREMGKGTDIMFRGDGTEYEGLAWILTSRPVDGNIADQFCGGALPVIVRHAASKHPPHPTYTIHPSIFRLCLPAPPQPSNTPKTRNP